jgi:ribosomal protein S18 acetylase RimI-like enzyme
MIFMQIIPVNTSSQQQVIDALHEILKDEWGSYVSKEKDPDLFQIKDYYINDGGNFWICIDDDHRVIGTIALKIFHIHEKTIAYLKRFYLRKEYRGRGIGKNLLDTAISFCRKNTISEIVLGTNPESDRAIQLFRKAGFHEFELYKDLPTFDDQIFMKMEITA